MEILDPIERLKRVNDFLNKETELLNMQARIQSAAKEEMGKSQREYFLREQLRAIQQELGETDARSEEIAELRKAIESAKMPPSVEKEALKQLGPLGADASGRCRIGDAPHIPRLAGRTSLEQVDQGLPRNRPRQGDSGRGPLLPGKDQGPHPGIPGSAETEEEDEGTDPLLSSALRGSARPPSANRSPGPWVASSSAFLLEGCGTRLKSGDTAAPMSARCRDGSSRGSSRPAPTTRSSCWTRSTRSAPISAAIRPRLSWRYSTRSRTTAFSDHYINLPFNLSNVMFIATANQMDTIPAALQDRMEVITLSGYTEEEKLQIVKRYLVPRQVKENGITEEIITISDEAIKTVIAKYTREAGLRNLEREIGSICRKVARKVAEGEQKHFVVNAASVPKYLGPPTLSCGKRRWRRMRSGVVTGLAWTPVGGEVLFVEATVMKGKGALTLTGHLGEVMKESVQAALSYIRSKAAELSSGRGLPQHHGHPRPCPRRRDTQGWSIRRSNHGDRAGFGAYPNSGPKRCGHDR